MKNHHNTKLSFYADRSICKVTINKIGRKTENMAHTKGVFCDKNAYAHNLCLYRKTGLKKNDSI